MKEEQRLLVKIMFSTIFPRKEGTNQISWDHKHFIYFLSVGRKINLATYIFNHLCSSIRSAQNPQKKTPQIAYPILLSEIFNQCGLVKRIQEAQAHDLLEETRRSFFNGHTLVHMKFVSSKSLKYPTKPLLKRKSVPQASDDIHFLFSNEPREVILEFMRLMNEEGIIITGDDIAKVSPLKERKDSSESEEDLPASEGKDTTGTEGASEAHVSKGKEPIVSDTAVIAAATPKRKRANKEKVEKVVEKKKEKVSKKQRTQKKKAPRVVKKFVVQEEDDEETDEEPLLCKRKRTVIDKDQPESKRMTTEAETGNIHSSKDKVIDSQAQTPHISSPLNQPLPEIDIDPSLLQPINIAYPSQTSELPPITSETDLDTVAEG
ncbi:hypothetical protein A2U01_0014179, partial [Trifolium medium]|nr:hypothetical protein [Trifolium medium]